MNEVFAPGCAQKILYPQACETVLELLKQYNPEITEYLTCCQHAPGLPDQTRVISICPGCDYRYRTVYESTETISLWEYIDALADFPFPDYGGLELSVFDHCRSTDVPPVLAAVRSLLKKMNIHVVEESVGSGVTCCGGGSCRGLREGEFTQYMTAQMKQYPKEEICVYGVFCLDGVYAGGKKPRYLLDLLFGWETKPQPDGWRSELSQFIAEH